MTRKRNRSSVVKDNISTLVNDNTAASTGNSGTIHIGKGTDKSLTTKLELRDSTISINLNSDRKEDENIGKQYTIIGRRAKIVALSLGVAAASILLLIRVGVINISKQQKK